MSHATSFGTGRYQERALKLDIPATSFRPLGRTGWQCSELGFGCYRIDDQTLPHIHALEKALKSGCNLIDTSTNYTDGGSERCVGNAVHGLIERDFFKRDEVIIVSKVGYVQGENLRVAMEAEKNGNPYPDMVKYADGCWHCIHPRFIRDQLENSLKRLRLQTVDVYLLHNPEYFFSDAVHRKLSTSLPSLRQEFYRRITAAFECLEDLVQEGKIAHYGVSSNSFGRPFANAEMTSLTEMWSTAEKISVQRTGKTSDHHFSVIQLPANIFESGPMTIPNNENALGKTVLQFAVDKSVGVLVNRPLNAFSGNQLIRLADFKIEFKNFPPVPELASRVEALEKTFLATFSPKIELHEGSAPPDKFFNWGRDLAKADSENFSAQQWSEIETYMIHPQLHYLLEQLDHYFKQKGNTDWSDWRMRYGTAMEELMAAIRQGCLQKSQEISKKISEKLDVFMPDPLKTESLSRKALGFLVNVPGVTCVLNGMRKPEYVEDSLGVLRWKPFSVSDQVYKAFTPKT